MGAALRDQGHEVRLIPAQFVKPFVKSNKNDFIDAEAIAESVSRHNMRFVPIKTDDQLDLQALHRVRDRLVHRRTAVINQIRGFLPERGITFPERTGQATQPDARSTGRYEPELDAPATEAARSSLAGVEAAPLGHPKPQPGDRHAGGNRSRLSTPAANPRNRTVGGNRHGRCHWKRSRVP